jgi:AraC-like DNA-binding protein
MPITSPYLLISLGSPVQVLDAFRAKPFAMILGSWIMGTWSVCHIADWSPNCRFFGVRFKPGVAHLFLQLPISELHNQFVPLEPIWGHAAAEISERLYAARTIQVGFALLDQFLLARFFDETHGLKIVRYAVAQLAKKHGALSIRALSDHIGISQNHLLTQFKRMVGVSPKEMAGLYRLQQVFCTIDPTKPVDWARIAQQCGYYDQAHFNKDFKAHLGQNPTDYLRLRRRLQAENPEYDQLHRTLPFD